MPDKKNKIICMLSCRHHLLDDRIYRKEACTLARNGYDVVHIGYGKRDEAYYTPENIRIIQLKRLEKGTTLQSKWKAFNQLRLDDLFRAAQKVSADVYHLHDMELCRIAGRLKKLPQHPKIIYDAHEPFSDNLKDYWRERSLMKVLFNDIPSLLAEKRIMKHADHLIATEENVASRFRKKNSNTSVLYNYSHFNPLNSLQGTEEKEFDVIYCGSVAESKGIFLMIDALLAAKKKGHSFKLVIVGPFNSLSLQSEVEAMIRREKLEKQLFFTGEVPVDQVSEYYQKSKAAFCLFPLNRTNQLILPIKLFEYAAFGLPVIGSNFGHIREIIQANGIGITVDPHKADEVASALIELMDGNRYKDYIPSCIHCVKTHYLWENQEQVLLLIYETFFLQKPTIESASE
ncbi:glycosyl transferase [Bacteroidia bacterium]|nr:glycosyl transferase [Bacteroidia bacterium]GHT04519.1 glycosyl transferase [Bacteroidia bacterium]GHT46147.1 glycosyl transferase [Bacteroidia bacterium]